jgi:hypothetical protein
MLRTVIEGKLEGGKITRKAMEIIARRLYKNLVVFITRVTPKLDTKQQK